MATVQKAVNGSTQTGWITADDLNPIKDRPVAGDNRALSVLTAVEQVVEDHGVLGTWSNGATQVIDDQNFVALDRFELALIGTILTGSVEFGEQILRGNEQSAVRFLCGSDSQSDA